MKFLWGLSVIFTSLLFSQTILAAASAPVEHQHGGRSHTHPLPVQGVAHRHGNSAYGKLIQRSGTISGNPTPDNPAQTRNQGGSITGSLQNTQSSLPPRIEPAQTTPTPAQQGKRYDKAITSCARNSRNCNVCAVNVRQQFNRAASGQINWRTDSWRFGWDHTYPPEKIRARDLFAGKKKYLLGIPDKHIQGFIHTNSSRYPFAGSHSHRKTGGILLINQNPQGEKHLAALFKANTKHPSGVHAIGQYLAYGEQGHLYLKDLERPSAKDIGIRLPGPKANFGGGLGLVRLADGGHLMITTGPGGQDQRPRSDRFYHLRSKNKRPHKLRFLNQSPYATPANWPKGFGFSENLSLITECGSGDIYAVHATGDQDPLNVIRGKGYWRLSQVVQTGKKLRLQPVSAFINRQSMDKCSMRATATVYVNPDNKIQFYCHGYAKNPKGSTLNVLGKSKNKFSFMVGTPK
ncbi:MAG: hypothetical protein ACPGVP_18150 [Thiolinea sp.]